MKYTKPIRMMLLDWKFKVNFACAGTGNAELDYGCCQRTIAMRPDCQIQNIIRY